MGGLGPPQRAKSLAYRFENEDRLLARANERPIFGWGGWARNRVYDPVTGKDLATTDGRWTGVIGKRGWTGYIAEFGLLTWALLILAWRREGARAPPAALFRGRVLCANLIDLLPNSGMTPVTWLVAGSLTGAVAQLQVTARRPVPRREALS